MPLPNHPSRKKTRHNQLARGVEESVCNRMAFNEVIARPALRDEIVQGAIRAQHG
jgi:hypothetical protein